VSSTTVKQTLEVVRNILRLVKAAAVQIKKGGERTGRAKDKTPSGRALIPPPCVPVERPSERFVVWLASGASCGPALVPHSGLRAAGEWPFTENFCGNCERPELAERID
jgi:hypothetical protein